MVTDKDYFRSTNCSWSGKFSEFTIEEAQILLEAWGYQIMIHKGLAKCEIVKMEAGGSVLHTDRYIDNEREIILAVKVGDEIAPRVDDNIKYGLKVVFNKELKQRLMKFLINLT